MFNVGNVWVGNVHRWQCFHRWWEMQNVNKSAVLTPSVSVSALKKIKVEQKVNKRSVSKTYLKTVTFCNLKDTHNEKNT